jgi:CRISPR-associated protein Csb2
MCLVLEIEHLLGVAFAARGSDSGEPDWPPQPDRVFSALVAAWAARGQGAAEREALEWLEAQDPPLIEASSATARPAPASFVPPNDKLQITANPAWRTRQPRRFPAALPVNPVVRLVWPGAAEAPIEVLDAVARDVAYVGHSASLTRCRFTEGEARASALPASRRVYAGRLKELEAAFGSGRRPSPGDAVRPVIASQASNTNTFSSEWLTFEINKGALDLRAAPLACKTLIKALMSGFEATAGPDAIPGWVSGHEPDGAPSRQDHLSAVPLAYVGFRHADGALMGFALVPPAGRADALADANFRRALLAITRPNEQGARALTLTFGRAGEIDLVLSLETERASLNPDRYIGQGYRWATVTPLVLDRHLKASPGARQQLEIEALVADACERSLGQRPLRVVADKHSAVIGAPSAYPSGKAPGWTGWRLPETLLTRRLTHAVLEFEAPVTGPLLIGAGRFCGLGLCLPLDGERR